MPKWSQAPAVEEQQTPRWMEAEVIDEGGPRSFMSRTLDEIDPNGAGRRADVRALPGPERRKADGLERSNVPEVAGLLMRTINPVTGVVDFADRIGKAGERKDAIGRLSIAPTMLRHGLDVGMSDERAGVRAQNREVPVIGEVFNRAMDFIPGGNVAQGLQGAIMERFGADSGAFQDARTETQARVEDARSRFPGTSMLFETAGSAGYGGTGVKQGATLVQQAVAGAKTGGALSAAYGFGGNNEDRIGGAVQGGLLGVLLGGTLGGTVGAIGNKASTGQFFPGQSAADILNMSAEDFSRTGAARLLRTALSRSDVPSKDVASAVGDAFRIFQMSGNLGNRPLTFAQALERTLEQKGYAQAAGNVKSIFQQLQASRAGQGMSQSLDDMAGSQESYIASALDDTLGPATLAKERARIRGDQRAIGDAQEDAINQARSAGGNDAGTPQIRQMVERAEMDPNPTVTSWLNRAARDMGFTQTGATQGQKAVPAFRNAATGDPLGFAKQIVRTINKARTDGAQLDAVTMNLLDEAQTALNAATKTTRGPGGRFGYNKMGSFNEGQQKFRLTYEEMEAQTQKFIGLARDPLKRAEFSEMMASAPEQVKNAVRTKIKEDIAAALKSGNVDDVMPYLGGLRQKGLHEDLVAFLGDDGEKISKVLRDVLEEQNWIKSVDARRLAPADRTSIGRNADVKNIYTANPLTRLANKTPIMTTLVGDVATGAITGTPALTAAKVIGHLTGPSGKSVRQLAQTLALRARQGGAAVPPNRGTLSRMTPATGQRDTAMVQQANEIQRGAEMRTRDAQARLESLRSQINSLKGSIDAEEQGRALRVEEARLAGEVEILRQQEAAARKVTDTVLREVAKAARKHRDMVRKTAPKRASTEALKAREAAQARTEAERLQVETEFDRTRIAFQERIAQAEAARRAATNETARREAEAELNDLRARYAAQQEAADIRSGLRQGRADELSAAERARRERDAAEAEAALRRVREQKAQEERTRQVSQERTALSEEINAAQAARMADERRRNTQGILATAATGTALTAAGAGAYIYSEQQKKAREEEARRREEWEKLKKKVRRKANAARKKREEQARQLPPSAPSLKPSR